jgi:peptide/nickel transport system permease protein
MAAEQVLVRSKPSIALRASRSTIKFFRKRPLGAFGALSLVFLVFVAIFASQIAAYSPVDGNGALYRFVGPGTDGPHGTFWFGTDKYARDLFSRIIFGSRISLYVGILSVIVGGSIGTFLGVASGYISGAIDMWFQRIVDTMLGFPSLILAMLLMASLGSSLNNVVLAIAISMIPRFIRLARSSALQVREQDYVTAARALGAPGMRILLGHVMPNSLTPVIVLATGLLGTAVVTEASLSFLGLGVPPPHPAWGRLLSEAQNAQMEVAPWLALFPGIALTFAVYGFNMFGDAMRDQLDPRLRGA